MSSALINRSLTNVRTELEFLRDSNVISEQVYNNILDQIPIKYDPNQSRTSINTPPPPPQAPPTNATGEYVEALYEFQPQQNGDLHIRPGDKIEVLEKLSPEWFKGRCNGNVGMFPSNYVKPAFSNNTSMVKAEPPQYSQSPQPPQPSQPPQQMQYQPPFPPPSTGYYQQPAPQPQQIVVQQEQPQNTGSSQLKKFGSKLGNAAIFGAGATLGSDLVNSIF
ncbi:Pin3p PWA37_000853 [Arxiozyma heterogenica]|uniref:SH3 domain-containing protein n=1 Tax=Arxiozyma heterogenica TaxID=278026 RepID=A0AAN8A9S3_9SACH|nr:hypothetical protein RI543_000664 [Kazachstania heterogenica]